MHCSVMSLLLCSFSSSSFSSLIVFVPSFPQGLVFFGAHPANVFSGLSSLTGWLQVRLQQFRDSGDILSQCCFDHFGSGLLVPPNGPLPATSWLRRPCLAPGPVLCVTPSSGWFVAPSLWTPNPAVCDLLVSEISPLSLRFSGPRGVVVVGAEHAVILGVWTQRANGDLGTHVQSR